MGKRTGRPRGAPPGNQNRLTHGRYAASAKAEREARAIERAKLLLMAAWTDVVWRTQKLEDQGTVLPDPLEP